MKTKLTTAILDQPRWAAPKPVLRYVGGKGRLLPLLSPYLHRLLSGETCFVDGFIGGGSVTLWAATHFPYLRIIGCDKNPFIAAFWSVVSGTIRDARRLCAALDVTPTLELFDRVQERMKTPEGLDTVKKAALAVQAGGPLGGRHQSGSERIGSRYNVQALCCGVLRLHELLAGRFTAYQADALEIIPRYRHVPGFYDPPYFAIGHRLYHTSMTEQEHVKLAAVLQGGGRWLLTYDDNPRVRALYEGWAEVDTIPARYCGVRGNDNRHRPAQELVIFPCGSEIRQFAE
jgi:site-specific DNA-adenine methylase